MTNLRLGQSRSPDYIETLRAAISQGINGLFVGLPGRVDSYNPVTQKASIKPLLKRAFIDNAGNEGLDELPVLPDVPVIFPRGGGYYLSMPIEKNDNVLLLFCDRSIDTYMVSTGVVDLDPVDLREHDLSDAVAIPGFFPTPKVIKDVIATDAVFGKEQGAQIRAKGSTVEVTTAGAPTSTAFVANATKVTVELGKIATAITGLGGSYTPGSVASTNLKAD
jgi:hypothetical protein